MWEKAVGELFEIVKELIAANKARGEAVSKAIEERLSKAERELYEARKTAHERASAPFLQTKGEERAERDLYPEPLTEMRLSNPDASMKELAEQLEDDSDVDSDE